MDKCREEFEAWCKTVMSDDSHFCIEWGDYINLNVRLRWDAWKAARRAITVELPDYRDAYTYQSAGFNEALDMCYEVITDSGITVKGD